MDRLLLEAQKPVTLEANTELRQELKQVMQFAPTDQFILHSFSLSLSEVVINLVKHTECVGDISENLKFVGRFPHICHKSQA